MSQEAVYLARMALYFPELDLAPALPRRVPAAELREAGSSPSTPDSRAWGALR